MLVTTNFTFSAGSNKSNFLNEGPMTEYLEKYTSGERPLIHDYSFNSCRLDTFVTDRDESHLSDPSMQKDFTVNVYGMTSRYMDITF